MNQKLLALVGKPNVGKSTLFNRLSVRKKAIVHNLPGVTRDRKYADAKIGPMLFRIVDTPGVEESKEGKLEYRMMEQTMQAVIEADLVCLIVDVKSGITMADKFFASLIRKHNKNYIVVANKSESKNSYDKDFYTLGFGNPIPISAEHGQGLADLYEAIEEKIDTRDIQEVSNKKKKPDSIQIVITGRPNSGKSTFINSILGKQRVLTGPEAGITRESIEIKWEYKNYNLKIVDTAGLRKKSNIKESLEKLSTRATIDSIKFANTVILMLDSTVALEQQDLSIANHVIEEGRSLVILVNKWDLIKLRREYEKDFTYRLGKLLPQVKGIPVIYTSVINGDKTNEVLDKIIEVYDLWNKKITTRKLNEWLAFAVEKHPLPIHKKLGRRLRIKYVTQIKSRPPTFKFFSNDPDSITEAYIRYLLNSLRENFSIPGVPVKMYFSETINPYRNNR